MKDRKAVFMDIDGTLLGRNGISAKVISTIRKARAQGHLFFICTGRSKGYIPAILRNVDYIDGYIMSCGMHCELHGESVYRQLIDKADLQRAAKYFCENGRECHFDGETRMIGLNSQRQDFVRYTDYKALESEFDAEPISKMTIPGDYRKEDGEFFGEKFTVYDMGGWSDVVLRGVSKATGMQHMLERLGISRENSIGIGDGSNDLPMIRFAGLGVAMGNAPDHVKSEADAVTETYDNDGVARMIEKYILKDAECCENR